MPELAEVEYFRTRWNGGLRQTVLRVHTHPRTRIFKGTNSGKLSRALAGTKLMASRAHGKQLLFEFSGGGWLGLHLGMTGKLRVEPANFQPSRHDHLVLFQKARALVFTDPRQFGRIRFDQGPQPPDWWQILPPDLFAKEFTLERLQSVLQRHRRAPLKAVLLLQRYFPGIGNWMADEILWRAKIFPGQSAGLIGGAGAKILWREIKFVSRQAMAIIAPDFSDPPKSWLFQHRWKKGGHCPRDGAGLRHATIGGRTTC
jgi:formamidopyrimidine-DNA glycosylase